MVNHAITSVSVLSTASGAVGVGLIATGVATPVGIVLGAVRVHCDRGCYSTRNSVRRSEC